MTNLRCVDFLDYLRADFIFNHFSSLEVAGSRFLTSWQTGLIIWWKRKKTEEIMLAYNIVDQNDSLSVEYH